MPGDYSVIYNINPVYQGGIDGGGTTVAVVGRSNFFVQDVIDFQQLFALPFNPPQIIFDGADPGNLGGGEEAEALLDVTWSGAVARGAEVKFVLSAGTDTTDGVVLSELYIIDNNVGDVMTQSFGGCEAAFTSTEAAGFSALAEEAAAQGITYVVATGDTGSAGCDNLAESIAQGPISVSLQAATPFTIAAGGTQFNENGHDSTYWNSTNDPFTLASAKSYIPENVWNETCTTQCATGAAPLASGGGGVSTFFSKPSWQAGVTGIPNDGHRDIPDISLSASSHDPYILCFEGSCQSGQALGISGTSASAPSFAGVIALVNQQTGSRQGQANYVLYRLAAAETLSQCNGSKTTALPGANCIFNDVTVGNNAVPGETGYGTATAKYQSTVGYDLATGLGSVNVANLLNAWSSVTFRPTTATLTLTPATFTHGTAANVSITVAPGSGSGTPDGRCIASDRLAQFAAERSVLYAQRRRGHGHGDRSARRHLQRQGALCRRCDICSERFASCTDHGFSGKQYYHAGGVWLWRGGYAGSSCKSALWRSRILASRCCGTVRQWHGHGKCCVQRQRTGPARYLLFHLEQRGYGSHVAGAVHSPGGSARHVGPVWWRFGFSSQRVCSR